MPKSGRRPCLTWVVQSKARESDGLPDLHLWRGCDRQVADAIAACQGLLPLPLQAAAEGEAEAAASCRKGKAQAQGRMLMGQG
eukprot:1158234-Pelagomonas_calceolata.AAC.2